ncbi:flavin reductase family protein [Streptomyces sp. NPDC088350]|uniref:flavin reductase family protein n=1 Tax=Streptomyces sp. NPDC088350 TaxID=3365854 RepID=UPI003815317D
MLRRLPLPPAPAASSGPSGTAEAAAPAQAGGVGAEEFRAALGRLAAGVVLVTAREKDNGDDAGMTATAFLSVSLEPPLVLVSVRTGSRMDDILAEQSLWAVSLLDETQKEVAAGFATKGRLSDRLLIQDLRCKRGAVTGAPLIPEALASLECVTEQRTEAGDHTLIIGRVLSTRLGEGERGPLAYYRGRFRGLI